MLPLNRFREPKQNTFTYEIATLIRGVWRTTEIAGRALADPRSIITLADSGALIDEPKLICRFINAVISLNPNLNEIKAYDQSGGGKTALAKLAAALFGNPRELIRTFGATEKNRQAVADQRRN